MWGRPSNVALKCEKHVITMLRYMFGSVLRTKYNFQIKVHHTMVSVYDMIDKCHLPTEYLPDDYTGPSAGTIADIAGRLLSYTVHDTPFVTIGISVTFEIIVHGIIIIVDRFYIFINLFYMNFTCTFISVNSLFIII